MKLSESTQNLVGFIINITIVIIIIIIINYYYYYFFTLRSDVISW